MAAVRWPWSRRVVVRPATGGTVEFPDAESAAEFMRRALAAHALSEEQVDDAIDVARAESPVQPPADFDPPTVRLRPVQRHQW